MVDGKKPHGWLMVDGKQPTGCFLGEPWPLAPSLPLVGWCEMRIFSLLQIASRLPVFFRILPMSRKKKLMQLLKTQSIVHNLAYADGLSLKSKSLYPFFFFFQEIAGARMYKYK